MNHRGLKLCLKVLTLLSKIQLAVLQYTGKHKEWNNFGFGRATQIAIDLLGQELISMNKANQFKITSLGEEVLTTNRLSSKEYKKTIRHLHIY